MAERRGIDEPRLLAAGPGRSARRSASRASTTGCRSTDRPSSSTRARRRPGRAGPRIGITKAAERPWRYAEAGSKLPQPADQAATAILRCIPGAAATPARGSWKTTRPAGPARLLDLDLEPAPLALPLRPSERQPDELRHDAVGRLGNDERHAVVGREPALARLLAEHDVELLAGLADLVDDRRRQRLPGEPRARGLHRLADEIRHVDLVRPAVRGLAAAPARRRRARSAAKLQLPLSTCSFPSRKTTSSRRAVRDVRGRERLRLVLEVRQRLLHERVPDLAGKVPPATGSPWYSVSIGLSSRG